MGQAAVGARGVPPPALAVAVAAILLFTADLLFGSRIEGDLAAAGHEVELLGSEPALRTRLADSDASRAAALIVDLTDERLDGAAVLESLAAADLLGEVPTLAFYSHVDVAVRDRAEGAGFTRIVPRSRMAREGAALLDGLLSGGGGGPR